MLLLALALLLVACSTPATRAPRPSEWATPVDSQHLQNFHRIDNMLYRSAQPDEPAMRELESLGIRTVLNLRYTQTDRDKATGTQLALRHFPMLATHIDTEDLIEAVTLIRQAEPPVLVHCYHGADRTGAVIAAWRILQQGWSDKAAIDEMLHGGYGHHYLLFPNIRTTLKNLQPNQPKTLQPAAALP